MKRDSYESIESTKKGFEESFKTEPFTINRPRTKSIWN